jgi:hypothetical protein
MIWLLMMLAAGPNAEPTVQSDPTVCATATIELRRGMAPSDYDDLKEELAKWLVKTMKDCHDPEA